MTYVAAIDQGTTSTRCMLFDADRRPVAMAQQEHRQILPRPGWVEHDPLEIRDATAAVVRAALAQAGADPAEIAAAGVTNQRETVVFWDPRSGQPLCNAIVWQDTRSADLCRELARDGGVDRFREVTGLPLATYFSGPKIRWALENVEGLRAAAERGRAVCGTIDSWVIWNLTGGSEGGAHVIDVTNASRTQLMDLRTLAWDADILALHGIPPAMLPRIVPSADPEPWGHTRPDGPFGGRVPLCGCVGDQQAALLGQGCVQPGDAKCTYGTGCFLLANTGDAPVASGQGLLTTVAWKLGREPAQYALEGSVAIAGALVQWLRDQLGLISDSAEVEELARSVDDSGGVFFVPAFSGLFAPRWRPDARGVVCGLTRFSNRAHLARAALEATAYQTRELLDAMVQDAGRAVDELRVDGGMTVNELLMQFQADLLGMPVVRAEITETTALGAACAAGLAAGVWSDPEELRRTRRAGARWEPEADGAHMERLYAQWNRAVERSLGWVED